MFASPAIGENIHHGSCTPSPSLSAVVEEAEHEKDRQKFYQDIGYSEDEEYYEFPKEVQHVVQ